MSQSSSRRSRAGFTLIELLVAISIIVILMGLTTSAVMSFRKTGPRLATQTKLRDLKSNVNTQWAAVRSKAQAETIQTGNQFLVLTVAGVTSMADPRARAAYVQLKLAQAFPQSFDEIMNDTAANGRLPAWQAYKTLLTGLGVTPANAATIAPANIQAAICLMMAVERGPSNLNISQESLGATGSKSFPVGAKYAFGVADAFGSPLTFVRGVAPAITSTNLDPSDSANQ